MLSAILSNLDPWFITLNFVTNIINYLIMCLVAIKCLDHNNIKLYILYIVNNALLHFYAKILIMN
jgi:hypothetical protein